ncbi:unnamed protein product [Caenorhabditis angaria]|uniref:Uncharacterized protein n=1 Tax=Caenorhabditis angaria TaxID=860376 RepID=A0A9P1IGC4_9PELO|nr:unnamed protein product [Caenorhabditis angaria]
MLFDFVFSQSYNNVYCRRPWYFDNPRPAPIPCPVPSFFSYYECCGEFRENCCWKLRSEPIYIVVICSIILLLICCCCCIGFAIFSLKKSKKQKQGNEVAISKDEQVQTVSNGVDDRRRSYVAARDREIDYRMF